MKFIIKIGLENKELQSKIKSDGNLVNLSGFILKLNKEKDIYRLSLITSNKDLIKWVALSIITNDELFSNNTFFYDDTFGTNAQTKILRQVDHIEYSSSQVVVYKNLDNGHTFGFGFVEANRFFQTIMQKKGHADIVVDMENKSLNENEEYIFERFMISKYNEDTCHFLDRYGRAIKKINNITFDKYIPSGFCSWSRYYGNINEEKINNEIKYTYKYLKDKKPNVIQLDDGWQIHSSFPGKYIVDLNKFPSGLEPLIKKTNNKKMDFGLWFAPTLVKSSSPKFEDIKNLICMKNKIDCLGSDVYAFDFDNPEYFEFLKQEFSYYRNILGVKYFKIDFLEHPFSHGFNYKSDYKIALFRKGLKAIRSAVGDDTILVGCTGFVLPFAGIFNINRVTCDIIWGNSPELPTYYELIQKVSKTIFYRYFYNKNLQINDPDGIVVRNYDVGDGFNASYNEAKIVVSMIASSGGSILHNEELNNLDSDRLTLIKRLSPALGISARPLDYFEYPTPTSVYINRLNAKNPYIYLSLINYGDEPVKREIPLSKFNLEKGIVIRSIDNKVLGTLEKIEDIIDSHSAEIYIIIPIPNKPEFLYSDINYTLGRELFSLKYINDNYSLIAKNKAFLKYNNYVYIPKNYKLFGDIVEELDDGYILKI